MIADLVVEYAGACRYSACHLTTKFREATGTPVDSWIVERRIIAARHVRVAPGRFRKARS